MEKLDEKVFQMRLNEIDMLINTYEELADGGAKEYVLESIEDEIKDKLSELGITRKDYDDLVMGSDEHDAVEHDAVAYDKLFTVEADGIDLDARHVVMATALGDMSDVSLRVDDYVCTDGVPFFVKALRLKASHGEFGIKISRYGKNCGELYTQELEGCTVDDLWFDRVWDKMTDDDPPQKLTYVLSLNAKKWKVTKGGEVLFDSDEASGEKVEEEGQQGGGEEADTEEA